MQFDWSAIWPAIPLLIEGAKMTLWISVLGLAGGLIIGLAAGFACLSKSFAVRQSLCR